VKNYELGRTVLNMIDARPELLDMKVYGNGNWTPGLEPDCGTVACLAGHAMIAAGYKMELVDNKTDFFRPDGSKVEWESAEAGELLGITGAEKWVFFSWNGPEEFRTLVEEAEKDAANEGRMA
jgi:hypothetical protein